MYNWFNMGNKNKTIWLIVLVLVFILAIVGFGVGVAGMKRGVSSTKVTY